MFERICSIWYGRFISICFGLLRKRFSPLQVLVVDPIRPESRAILKLAESFVVHNAPVRLGIVFDTGKGVGEENDLYRSIVCAFNYLTQKKTGRDALGFLTDVSAFPDS